MEAGLLRENYDEMITPHADVVEGLVVAISRLVEDRQLRARLGRTARSEVEKKYTMEQWNQTLKTAFDRARGITSAAPGDGNRFDALAAGEIVQGSACPAGGEPVLIR